MPFELKAHFRLSDLPPLIVKIIWRTGSAGKVTNQSKQTVFSIYLFEMVVIFF